MSIVEWMNEPNGMPKLGSFKIEDDMEIKCVETIVKVFCFLKNYCININTNSIFSISKSHIKGHHLMPDFKCLIQ